MTQEVWHSHQSEGEIILFLKKIQLYRSTDHLPCVLFPTSSNFEDGKGSVSVCDKATSQRQEGGFQSRLPADTPPDQNHLGLAFISF